MNDEVKSCRYCGEEILAVAVKCKHCGSNLVDEPTSISKDKPAADYGVLLLAIPVIATMLIWFWVASMNLLQSPDSSMALIMLFTVLGTAIVSALEASKVGMKTDRKAGTYSPVSWFFILALIWIIGYPVYMFKRRKYGLKNHVIVGLLVAIVFVGSWALMSAAIWEKKVEVRSNLQSMRQSFDSFGK